MFYVAIKEFLRLDDLKQFTNLWLWNALMNFLFLEKYLSRFHHVANSMPGTDNQMDGQQTDR